ncbi:MAG: B12-binding domain-containing radical SAM protein [Nanoarchaeota archaeon]|nr:B12-binding domain-containing radical SAM protein [Euryarchaeota archaeon]MBU4502530.1 B12-binding domain-containing radical SAM protein [Nanoarchaeota archaeon]
MARISLIEPPPWDVGSPNLGIAYLKSSLQAEGHEVRTFLLSPYFYDDKKIKNAVLRQKKRFKKGHVLNIYFDMVWDAYIEGDAEKFQLCEDFIERWAEEIWSWDAEIIGFSLNNITLPMGLRLAHNLRNKIRAGKNNSLLVAGGPTPSMLSHQLLPFFDIICIGEGEETFREIAANWDLKKGLESIAGTFSNFNGVVIHNPSRLLIKDIDTLPFPDFTDIPKKKYGAVSIQSSRGCVARCAFCDETIYWSKYRWREPEKVVEEIEFQHKRYRAKDFRFHDSLINGSPKNLEKICDSLIEKDLDISWGGNARVERLPEHLTSKMAEAGCRFLLIGIESASQNVLDSMGKKISVEEIKKGLKSCQNAGIWTHTHWMVGFPTEKWEDLENTVEFIEENSEVIDSASVHPFTMLTRFCDVFNNPGSYGITEIYPFREINLSGIKFVWEYGFKVEGRDNGYMEKATSAVEEALKRQEIPDTIFTKSLQGKILQNLCKFKYFRRLFIPY